MDPTTHLAASKLSFILAAALLRLLVRPTTSTGTIVRTSGDGGSVTDLNRPTTAISESPDEAGPGQHSVSVGRGGASLFVGGDSGVNLPEIRRLCVAAAAFNQIRRRRNAAEQKRRKKDIIRGTALAACSGSCRNSKSSSMS